MHLAQLATQSVDAFFQSETGHMLQQVGNLGGIASGVAGMSMAARGFFRGLGIKSLKHIAIGIFIGAFAMNLPLAANALESGQKVVAELFNTADETVNTGAFAPASPATVTE